MENTHSIGKRYSFLELFDKENYCVEIPIIQRDYAQGRASKKDVRETFLEALQDYLEENIANRDLDFVYGYTKSITGDQSTHDFVPLDGQQRLTTLFLLHWYLATASANLEVLKISLLRDGKSRFSYKTRTSSAEFCDALLNNVIDIDNLLVADDNKKNNLSKTIKNKHWFFSSWSLDPTIQSMLTMLDSIHVFFYGKGDYFQRLVDRENPIITFLFLDLDKLQQSDDLYIKMNARGKPLTGFENFKAKFEQEIGTLFSGEAESYALGIEEREVRVSAKEYFSFKVDAIWSNLFWNYRHLVGNVNTFDDELLNFIKVILTGRFILDNKVKSNDIDLLLTGESVTYNELKKMEAISKSGISSLIASLDSIYNDNNKIKQHLSDQFYYNEGEIFEKVLQLSISYPERILFYGYIEFLVRHGKNEEALFQWMRIIHNLVEHTRFDGSEQLINAMRSVDKMLPKADEILTFLAYGKEKIDFFFAPQVNEERLKARLCLKAGRWKDLLIATEKDIFHSGQIAYLFEFSGILSYFRKHQHVDWTTDEDSLFFNTFSRYQRKSSYLFSVLKENNNADYILERAALTKGNYMISSSNKYNFCSAPNMSNYLRDFSWKRLLRMNIDEDFDNLDSHWVKKRNYIKMLMDDEALFENSIKSDLCTIIARPQEGWRGAFINNPSLIRYCKQGFIYTPNFKKIHLLNASGINHINTEMHTYELFLRLNSTIDKEKIQPFSLINHKQVKGKDDQPYISIENWTYRKISYHVYLYWQFNEEMDQGSYYLEFKKSRGAQGQENYAPEILAILSELSLKWSEYEKLFIRHCQSERSLLSKLQMLCERLKIMSEQIINTADISS